MKLFIKSGPGSWSILRSKNGLCLFRNNSMCWSFNEGGYFLTLTRYKKIGEKWRLYIGYGRFSHVFRW